MNPENLVEYLTMVSNNNIYVNIVMHLLILIAIAVVLRLRDIRIKKNVFYGTLLLLFLSVTVNAFVYGNPFHLVTFGSITFVALVVLIKHKSQLGIPQKSIQTIMSFVLILLGLWYPELIKATAVESLILSPLGTVPCPTLITALGMLNLFYPQVNKKLFATTVFFGLVYGVIGSFILNVYFDLCLLGAVLFSIFNIAAAKGKETVMTI